MYGNYADLCSFRRPWACLQDLSGTVLNTTPPEMLVLGNSGCAGGSGGQRQLSVVIEANSTAIANIIVAIPAPVVVVIIIIDQGRARCVCARAFEADRVLLSAQCAFV